MTYPMEPVLTLRSAEVLLHRLRTQLCAAPSAGASPDSSKEPDCYRAAVAAEVRRLYGCPTPDGLDWLIEEARAIGAGADDMALFIGRQFRLKVMRPYSKSSS